MAGGVEDALGVSEVGAGVLRNRWIACERGLAGHGVVGLLLLLLLILAALGLEILLLALVIILL